MRGDRCNEPSVHASRRAAGCGKNVRRHNSLPAIRRWRFLTGLCTLFMMACGSEVVIQSNATSVGSGGAPANSSAASASGGSMASSSSAMASVATSTGSGGGAPCTGWDDPSCGPAAWCDVGADLCGGSGVCRPRPQACDDDCPGVCGCDGSVYCNSCRAQGQGVAVAKDAVCDDGSYAAKLWIGGLDRLIISKKDVTNKLCIRVHATWPADTQPTYPISMPSQWAVIAVEYSQKLSDCDNIQRPGPGGLMSSSSATGSINWTIDPGKNYPCTLDIQMNVTLPMGQQILSKTGISVEDGCT